MTDFYIFRHGDTIETSNLMIRLMGRRHDSHNLHILPKGRAALEKIGKYLKDTSTSADFRSPYIRCAESAEIVEHIINKKFEVDERIRELENNGEPFSSFHGRVKSFLDDVQKKNYFAVSICTHGAVIAALKNLIAKGKFKPYNIFDYPYPGNLIIIKNGTVSQINFNNIS